MGEHVVSQWFYDCPQCGEIGGVAELKAHPTREMPEDLGFCPHCGREIEEFVTAEYIGDLLRDYGDDPALWFSEWNARAQAATPTHTGWVESGK